MSRSLASLVLLLAAFFWGMGNIAQKLVLEHLDPLTAVALRCLIGGALFLPFLGPDLRRAVPPGFIVSLIRVTLSFGAALCLQQTAFLSTSVTNAGFLINTCAVLTPLVAWAWYGARPTRLVAMAASLSLAGSFLLAGGTISDISDGDALALMSALVYAVWIVELARHTQTHGRPVLTAFAQIFGTGLLVLPLPLLTGGIDPAKIGAALPALLALAIFPTALAFGLTTLAQRHTDAGSSAVLMSAEAVFGAAAAAVLLGERSGVLGMAGMALILTAIILIARQPETGPSPVSGVRAPVQ